MKQTDNTGAVTLDTYIKGVKDQEVKGILLKLKNEMRKPLATRDAIESILMSLKEKNSGVAEEVIPLIEY